MVDRHHDHQRPMAAGRLATKGTCVNRLLPAWSLLIPLLTAAGCGSETMSNLPATVPASGVVTLDGQPVEGAQVTFVPQGDTTGSGGATASIGATAATDRDGRFSLRANGEKEGAVPGSYKVQVSKTVAVKLDGPGVDGGDPVRYDFGVPRKYTATDTSGLSVEIPASGKTDIRLELVSK
jgi:hypothetical protein